MPQLANSAARLFLQHRYLRSEFAGKPLVVIIAERNQLSIELGHSSIAGTGQAGSPSVGQDSHTVTVGHALVRLAPVVDNKSVQVTRVILG